MSCATTYDLISSSEYGIQDSALSASSMYGQYFVQECRLDSPYGWSPNGGVYEWIRADLGETRIMVAIRTRGCYFGYIRQFKISVSINGEEWSDVVNDSGSEILFEGNPDSTTMNNLMPNPIETRHVQLTIMNCSIPTCLRWAIDGCPMPTH